MTTLKQKLIALNRKNKKLQKELAKQHKLKRRIYQRKRQQTCPCDRYWFPHRYEFGKCKAWGMWDEIALEVGAKSKKMGGNCPF